MKKFSKTIQLFTLGRAAEPPYLATISHHTITQPSKPSYTKTPTKELPEQGHPNQYSEPPSNPPYTAIYQYNESPPILHHSS